MVSRRPPGRANLQVPNSASGTGAGGGAPGGRLALVGGGAPPAPGGLSFPGPLAWVAGAKPQSPPRARTRAASDGRAEAGTVRFTRDGSSASFAGLTPGCPSQAFQVALS